MVVGVVVLSALWVGLRGLLAAHELQALERSVSALQTATADPANRSLDALSGDVQDHARRADRYTHDVVWKVWSRVPLVGPSLTVTADISAQGEVLATRALPALVRTAVLARGLRHPDGTFDPRPLALQAKALSDAAAVLNTSALRVQALPTTRVSAIDHGREKLARELRSLATRAQSLAVGASTSSDLLGFKGARRYLIAVQNNAEARASGGIVGAYGLMTVMQGKPALGVFGSDNDLVPGLDTNAIDFGTAWHDRYDALGQARDWREVTATPDFPTAAATMLALWKAMHHGEQLDGVISVDPVALGDILQATGPVTTSTGRVLRSDDFVTSTLRDAYVLFPDKARRTAVLSDNARAVFKALVHGSGAPLVLAERLGNAIVTSHFKIWSAHPAVQAQLSRTAVAGALPSTASPLLGIYTQAGNNDKLSCYLRRSIRYDVVPAPSYLNFGAGPQRQEVAHIQITLTNTAPASGLPDYVAPDRQLSDGTRIPPGQMRVAVSVYVGATGTFDTLAVDGQPTAASSQQEKGLTVITTAVDIAPGHSRTLELLVRQPAPQGAPLTVLHQPLVAPDAFVAPGRQLS